jgi:GntR family transcriptional regulator/MocR family aminotransferase
MWGQVSLVQAIGDQFHGLLQVSPYETGMHLVGWLPDDIVAQDVCRRAAHEGLILLPLSSYRAAPRPEGVLPGFSEVSERLLQSGVTRLRGVLTN